MADILSIIGSVCAIIASVVSLFTLSKVTQIGNAINIKGNSNVVAGGDINTSQG